MLKVLQGFLHIYSYLVEFRVWFVDNETEIELDRSTDTNLAFDMGTGF
jgi:hypothetical protein